MKVSNRKQKWPEVEGEKKVEKKTQATMNVKITMKVNQKLIENEQFNGEKEKRKG